MTKHNSISKKPNQSEPHQPHYETARSRQHDWVEQTLGADAVRDATSLDQATVDPAICRANPDDVLCDPTLSAPQKRQLLLRWAFNVYRAEVTVVESSPDGTPSRFDEVIDALIDLEDAKPFASIAEAEQTPASHARRAARAR